MRADLLALTPDALSALANRGLVKRATKELDAGNGPEIEQAADGGIHGRFADGVEVLFPPGSALDGASCSCGAPGVCRHRIAVVLGYQRRHEQAPEFTAWSPGAIDDATLTEALGSRVLAAAERARRSGFAVRLRRPTAADPVAVAELPTATVRFLVPGELGYAHTDAAARDELVVLAVWAFRAADERGLTEDVVHLDVGATGPDKAALGPALDLTARLLRDGVTNASPVLRASLSRVREDLTAAALHWPAAAVDELADQLDAYAARSARHSPERCAALLAELPARFRATGSPALVLGTEERPETRLRRVRLTALGARVHGSADERRAEVFFAVDGSVLVLKARWDVAEGEAPTGHDLGGRRVGGVTLERLATANVVSESVVRSASRTLRLGAARAAKMSVTPVGDAWAELSPSLLVRDFEAAAERLAHLPPKLVRPRIEAEDVVVLEIAEVLEIGYHPGAQRLDAVVADAAGARATISATYRGTSPGRLDALGDALAGEPRFVSGALRRSGGRLLIDPAAVLTGAGLVVPDLAAGASDSARGPGGRDTSDHLRAALDAAASLLAEAAHRGLAHATPNLRTRFERFAEDLARTGLTTVAARISVFAGSWTVDDWVAAQTRVLVAAEFR